MKILILLVLMSVFSSCTEEVLIDVYPLERQLIITWIALDRNDHAVAAEYNALAQESWRKLRSRLLNTTLSGTERQSISLVDLWMTGVGNAINNGQPRRATMHLTLLQNEFSVLRPAYGLQHPADKLYSFYYEWERLLEAGSDPMMCLLEWGEFENVYRRSRDYWADYQTLRPTLVPGLFPGFSARGSEAETAGLALTRSLNIPIRK